MVVYLHRNLGHNKLKEVRNDIFNNLGELTYLWVLFGLSLGQLTALAVSLSNIYETGLSYVVLMVQPLF